jgi:hypothetical protein
MNSLIFHRNSQKIFLFLFLFLFSIQFIFWINTNNVRPEVGILPPLPNKATVQATSLGDTQFYFRLLSLRLQNAGDSFGRFTSLKKYDYNKLYSWLHFLSDLDFHSNVFPSLASYYYTSTAIADDARIMVQYLDEHSSRDIDKKWWWMFQASNIARYIVKDNQLALDLAYKLQKTNAKGAPYWVKQLPALLHARMGESCQSFLIINKILQDIENKTYVASQEEMDFMRHFIDYRLKILRKEEFNPKSCPIAFKPR